MPNGKETRVFSWMGNGGAIADSDLAFFADESGNTFVNYLASEQPFHVTGGWLLREADIPLAEAITAGCWHPPTCKNSRGRGC